MLQAFTPIVTMVALFVAQLETPTRRLISAVVLIAGGTAMASYGEVNMSVIGLIFMFSSEAFEAIRLVMTQMLLVGHKFHPSALPLSVQKPCTPNLRHSQGGEFSVSLISSSVFLFLRGGHPPGDCGDATDRAQVAPQCTPYCILRPVRFADMSGHLTAATPIIRHRYRSGTGAQLRG